MEKSFTGKVVFEGAVAEAKGIKGSVQVAAELPASAVADAGKVLTVNAQGAAAWAAIPAELSALPADASTKTYALQAVNGVLTWVEVTA